MRTPTAAAGHCATRQSDEYLFPVTMISRRQEADNNTPVAVIYQKAYDIIAPLRPALPFR